MLKMKICLRFWSGNYDGDHSSLNTSWSRIFCIHIILTLLSLPSYVKIYHCSCCELIFYSRLNVLSIKSRDMVGLLFGCSACISIIIFVYFLVIDCWWTSYKFYIFFQVYNSWKETNYSTQWCYENYIQVWFFALKSENNTFALLISEK